MAAFMMSFTVFAGILATLWLVAAGDGGEGHRDVVIALPPATEALTDTAPSPSAGIDGGLVVSPMTPVAFSRLPPLALEGPLPPAPDPALIQTTSGGPLPVVFDGRLPRDVYARPHDPRDERARLVIIVSGVGLSRSASQAAIDRLPGAIVLGIDAYAARPDDWARAARRSGHEILATIPLEQTGAPFHDDGPRALRAAASVDDNLRRLHAVLGSLTGYVGALAVGGTAFGDDAVSLRSVLLDGLRTRGLLLVDATAGRESPLIRMPGPPSGPSRCFDRRLSRRVDRPTIGRFGSHRPRAIPGRRSG